MPPLLAGKSSGLRLVDLLLGAGPGGGIAIDCAQCTELSNHFSHLRTGKVINVLKSLLDECLHTN